MVILVPWTPKIWTLDVNKGEKQNSESIKMKIFNRADWLKQISTAIMQFPSFGDAQKSFFFFVFDGKDTENVEPLKIIKYELAKQKLSSMSQLTF